MSDVVVGAPVGVASVIRRAAVQARQAPSVHNTQPWRFALGARLAGDLGRLGPASDGAGSRGRQLLISCGCAVFNARVAAAPRGWPSGSSATPTRFGRICWPASRSAPTPRPTRGAGRSRSTLRQTNRRRFADDAVPADVVAELVAAAAAEGAQLVPVTRDDHRMHDASLSQQADRTQNADPAYRAELRRWTTDEADAATACRPWRFRTWTGRRSDDIPIRDFDTRGAGWLPVETHSACASACSCWAPRAIPRPHGCGRGRPWSGCCWRSPGTATSRAR